MAGYLPLGHSDYEALHKKKWNEGIHTVKILQPVQPVMPNSCMQDLQYSYIKDENLIVIGPSIPDHDFDLMYKLIRRSLAANKELSNPRIIIRRREKLNEKTLISIPSLEKDKLPLIRVAELDEEKLINKREQGNVSFIKAKILSDLFVKLESQTYDIQYRYDEKNNLLIITSPIEAHYFDLMHKRIRNSLSQIEPKIRNAQMLIPVKGNGLSEQHIITAHIDPSSSPKVRFYDSKASDMEKFFKDPKHKGFSLPSLFRALFPAKRINYPKREIDLQPNDNAIVIYPDELQESEKSPLLPQSRFNAEYHPLGIQSLFDSVSCGYDSVETMKVCVELIENGEDITTKNIKAKLGNPIHKATPIIEAIPGSKHKVKIKFSDFLRKAWLDTLVPLENQKIVVEEKEKASFLHHFLGWPQENTGKKVLYVLTLGFITNPLLNTLRLPIELPFNVLSETASYIKNKLLATAPTSAAGQYLRSALLLLSFGFQGLFKGGYLLLRTVTAPFTSFQAALQIKNPILRSLLSLSSLLLSVGAYSALAFFVAPLVLNALAPLAAPALTQVVAAIAYPFSQLFALMGVSLAPATAAAATLISGSALLVGIKGLANKAASVIWGKEEPAKDDLKNLEVDDFEDDIIGSTQNMAKGLGISSKQKEKEASKVLPHSTDQKGVPKGKLFTPPLQSASATANNNTLKNRSRHFGSF